MSNILENVIGLAKISNNANQISPYSNVEYLRLVIRESMINAGLGIKDPKNPFADIITPGMTVLLKPNWVFHFNRSGSGMDCMITHPKFIEAIIKEIIKANPKKIIIGDAPIQSTEFDEIITPLQKKRFKQASNGVELEVRDFRYNICLPKGMVLTTVKNPSRSVQGVLYNLGTDSLIEPLSTKKNPFRNTSYDHQKLNIRHHLGHHEYLLCPEIIESDIIINLPKLKTHRKTGITAALKNMVGVNGDKDYLPHHRVGGSQTGGDCYHGKNTIKRIAEYFLDMANQRINSPWEAPWRYAVSYLMYLNCYLYGDGELEGSWYGNDTIWRMVLDLNRIIQYGTKDGVLSDTKQRNIYSLTDAIIIGEGFGPLAPLPKFLGYISFASSSAFADLAHSALMKFDWRKIPIIFNSFENYRYPITSKKPSSARICFNGKSFSIDEFAMQFGEYCKPPIGWQDHIEIN